MAENTGAAAPPAADAPKASVFTRDGFPPLGELVPNALQHVLACFAGVITPAMILSVMCGLSQEEQSIVIQMALILSALDTILQQFPLFGKFGANLPIVTGVSYAFLMPLQAIGVELGFSAVLGCQIVGGIMSMIFGFCYDKVSRIFPPIVTGTVIFAIGVSLYPTAIKYMAGGAGSEIFGSAGAWAVGLSTFAIVFVLQTFAKGVFKIGAIFFGIIAGCLIAIPFGYIDPSGIAGASWFSLPRFMPFPIEFDFAACVTIAIVYVMVGVQLIGDLAAATSGSMDRMPTDHEYGGSLRAQGLVSVVSAFFGGLPTSAFGQNVGIIVSTKAINRWVFVGAAAVFAVAGLCPKLMAVLMMIPDPVIGGATISVFGTITLNGIRILVKDGLTPRSCTIFGISVAFGLGIYQVTGCLAGFPDWVTTIFATSAITPCAIMAIILNTVLPPEEPQNPVATEMVEAAEEALEREDEGLPEPMEPEILKKGEKAGGPLPVTEEVAERAARERGDGDRRAPGTDTTDAGSGH
ncbi:solute carrier family 23 protein [Olsenella sp. YH-ols2217]|uniref:Solute carrier family 23 protein n=1 Tax=Kribbibacterium absianum TaxID=3044210 RepID=A0ABT6ZJB4_9ACTN|nr:MULTISPECIES: solute carrier family 23 protein [unclassified Olsenella]MDJ1121117.1 solute carrier family 23 protein [Olsenella sp. YH-ols2216]MDJ1128608.1 solute carrier family 23 protein [Olsenella sp. YH-ols2217]